MAQAVEWSIGKSEDLIVEVWATAALTAAVIEALLEEPENLRRALRALGVHEPREPGKADARVA